MRFHEIQGGLLIPVSNEEQEVIDLIDKQDSRMIRRKDLDERQRELARKMVSRGVLERTQIDSSLYYRVSRLADNWRD